MGIETMGIDGMKARRLTLTVPVVAALALVAGCGGRTAKPDLGGACQLKPCECVKLDTVFWQADRTVPLEWRKDGSAFCPQGYELRRTNDVKK